MPPAKRTKTVLAEEAMAQTIKRLRENRDWSPAGLASRMTKAGCPMKQSAIWKIENGEPRRRITFDEAVTFARVFEVPLEDFAVPPELVQAEAAASTVVEMQFQLQYIENTAEQLQESWRKLELQWKNGIQNPLVRAAVHKAIGGDYEPEPGWGPSTPIAERMASLQGHDATDSSVLERWLDEMERRSKAVHAFFASLDEGTHDQ